MKHRHLNGNDLTLAAIDSMIERGTLADWMGLARECGRSDEARENVRRLCEARLARNDPEFYLAADYKYWLQLTDQPEDDAAVADAYRRTHEEAEDNEHGQSF